MTIGVACPSCGNRYDVTHKLAGRRVRCKGCHANFRVPVPTKLPADDKPRKPPGNRRLEALFDDPNEAAPEVPLSSRRPRSKPASAGTDLGASTLLRITFLAIVAATAYLAVRGPGANSRWASVCCLLMGAGFLVPSIARWGSLERSRRYRMAKAAFGEAGAGFAHRLAGCGFLMAAFLIASGLIGWPFAPEQPAPDAGPPPAAKAPAAPVEEARPGAESP